MHAIALVLLLLQSQALANAVRAADSALAQQAYAQARQAYTQVLTLAEAEGNKQEAWRANFYLGVTTEFLADTAATPETLLSEAAQYYDAAAKIEPASSIWNNLALLRARQGRQDDARAFFAKAIAANDDHRAFYEQNYAAFLSQTGHDREALTYYRQAAYTIPPTDELHDTILQLALRTEPHELPLYLSDLNRRGSPRVIPAILSLLGDAKAATIQDDLVNVLAQALTRTVADNGAALLSSLRASKHPGALQLASLLDERPPLATFSWWTRGDATSLSAFRELARALGRQRELLHQPDCAYYYRLAASGDPPDEQALVDLASYYASTNQRAALDDVVRGFESKSLAPTAYAFRRATGAIYAKLNQWANPTDPVPTAVYQLEHAELARKAINATAPRPLPRDADIYALLAKGYEITGQAASATRTRLDAAQTYLASGDKDAAREVLKPFQATPPSAPEDHLRYSQLLASLDLPRDEPFQQRNQTAQVATPTTEHKRLEYLVGTWDAKVVTWIEPGAEPLVTDGKAEAKWVLGNNFVEQRFVGKFMGAPFEGVSYTGYDAVKKMYVGTWMDNMSTSAMTSTGQSSPDGKTLMFTGASADPMSGKALRIEERMTIIDDNSHKVETWVPGPDEKLFKMMEVTYTRIKPPS
jgi:hypothetical protein